MSKIFEAIREGDYSIVKKLLEAGCDPNLEDGAGWTPLVIAINNTNPSIVELLLGYGADLNHITGHGLSMRDFALLSNMQLPAA